MADKQDKKDEITAVGPGADEDLPGAVVADADAPGTDYEYPEGEDDERVATRDERTGHAEVDTEEEGDGLSREQKRRRRKRERYDRDQRELALLRGRNEQLEREHSRRLATVETRQTQSDVMAIDSRISQAESDVREAESLLTQSLEAKDSASAVEALRVRDQLNDGLRQLKNAKQQTVRASQERQAAAQEQPTAVSPAIVARAQEWTRDHPWFDPKLGDDDSAVVSTIERRLFGEGRLDPASDAYWEEVDRRLAKKLPERYRANERDRDDDADDDDTRPVRRVNGKDATPRRASGPMIKVGGRERPLRAGEVFIDEDRKAAMVEAGVWDDPPAREKMLKAYQKYDREAGRRTR